MRYYEQLLESFNRLKKRTFKLTILEQGQQEGDAGAEGRANAQIETAKAKQATRDNPYQVPGVVTSTGHPIVLFMTQNGVNWSTYNNNKIGYQQSALEGVGREKFIGFFGEKEEGTQVGTQTAPGQTAPPGTGAPGGVPVVDPYMGATTAGITAMNSGFKDKELVNPGNLFEEMRKKAGKLCDKLSQMGINQTCNNFLNFFSGGASQSMERAYAPDKNKWSYDEDFQMLTKSPLNEQESKSALKKWDWLLDELNSDTDVDGIELNKKFAVTSNGSILITIGADGGDGFIIKDQTGVYKALLNAAKDKVTTPGFKLQEFTPRISSGSTKGIRGKMLEEVYMLRLLATQCAKTRPQGSEVPLNKQSAVCKMFNAASKRFQKHKANWPVIHEWAAQHNMGAAIKAADVGLYQVVENSGIDGKNLVPIVRAMFALSKEVDDKLRATMSVPVGMSPGEGEKPDVTYVWGTQEEARDGLVSLGFTDDDIATGMIKQGKIGEAFKGSSIPDLEQYYRDNHDPLKTDNVFYHGTGLKHFEAGMHSMHAGTRQHGTLNTTMQSATIAPVGSQMRERAKDYFGYSDVQSGEVDTYWKDKVNGILDHVNSTVTLVKSPDPTNPKKTITTDPLLDLINSHRDATSQNSTYAELRHDGLTDFMSEYVETGGTWKNKDHTLEERKHIAEGISRQLMWRRLTTDLHDKKDRTKQRTAQRTLQTTAFITGGAFDDTTSTSVRDLKTFDHMSFVHNEGMDFVRNGFVAGGGVDVVHPTGTRADDFGEGNSVKFVDKLNSDSYVTMRLSKDKGEPKWAVEYSVGFLKAHNRLEALQPTQQAASTRYGDVENLIQEYLDNQKDMLLKILSS